MFDLWVLNYFNILLFDDVHLLEDLLRNLFVVDVGLVALEVSLSEIDLPDLVLEWNQQVDEIVVLLGKVLV